MDGYRRRSNKEKTTWNETGLPRAWRQVIKNKEYRWTHHNGLF